MRSPRSVGQARMRSQALAPPALAAVKADRAAADAAGRPAGPPRRHRGRALARRGGDAATSTHARAAVLSQRQPRRLRRPVRASASTTCSSRGSAAVGRRPGASACRSSTAGRLRANLRGKAADLDAAIESYNAAVLDAVRDVADQVSSRAIDRAPAGRSSAARRPPPKSAYDLAVQRYRAGLGNYLNVLTAETTVLAQRRAGGRPAGARARRAGRAGARAGRRLAAADRRRPQRCRRTDRAIPEHTTANPKDHRHETTTPTPTPPPPPPTPRRASDKRRRALTALAAAVVVAGGWLGRLRMAGRQPLRDHRQRLRAGQRGPDHAAGRRHRDGDHGRRHRLREGRPAAGAARSGRRAGRARPGRGAARADGARRCARCTPTTARWRRRSRCARPTSRAAQSDVARAQDDLQRRAAAGRAPARSSQGRAQPRRDARSPPRRARWPRRRPAWSRRASSWPANQSLTDGTSVEQHPERAARRGRGCARPTWRCSAPTLPAPVDGYVAKRTRAARPARRGRRAADVGRRRSTRSGSTPTSRKCQLRNMRIGQPVDAHGRRLRQARSSTTAASPASAPAPAPRSRCCRRRTPPATGSRWCSACRCASRSMPKQLAAHPLRVGLSMDAEVDVHADRTARCSPTRRAPARWRRRRSTSQLDQRRRRRGASASSRPTSAVRAGARRARRSPRARRPHAPAAVAGVARASPI